VHGAESREALPEHLDLVADCHDVLPELLHLLLEGMHVRQLRLPHVHQRLALLA
jgi:hypothetical protein